MANHDCQHVGEILKAASEHIFLHGSAGCLMFLNQ